MTSEEIVQALRCISTPAGGEKQDCKNCPFYAKEQLGAALAEKLGVAEWTSCDCDAVGMAAAELIERLEKEKAARWIPVTERLPEDGVPVLVNYIGNNDGEMHPDGVAVWTDCGCLWWEGSLKDCDTEVAVPITHWMPLPKAPEVE